MKCPIFSQEDEMVMLLVDKYGAKRWTLIAKQLKGRIGKQCRYDTIQFEGFEMAI